MARTTAIKVQEILGSNWDGKSRMDPYMEVATDVVTQVDDAATEKDIILSSTRLELIERWLAAHYYTMMDPLYKSKGTDKASGTFMERSYKEVAIQLDTSASLSAIMSPEGPKVAEGIWLGEEDEA